MKPHIANEVSAEAWRLLDIIRQVIDGLPPTLETPFFLFGCKMDMDVVSTTYIPNCHTVVVALTKFLPVEAHHGIVYTTHRDGSPAKLQHAWLVIKGTEGKEIIDPWPLGVVSGPALFMQDYAFSFGNEFSLVPNKEFDSQVETVADAMRPLFTKLLSQNVSVAA